MSASAFFADLTRGIMDAGGAIYDEQRALARAHEAWDALRQVGLDAFPCMWESDDGLRFVYQWDEDPPLLVVMLWDDVMWRDMARIPVPAELQG